MHQEHVDNAILFLHFDEAFFLRSGNEPTPTTASVLSNPGTLLSWNTLGLLDFLMPTPAYAHGGHGSECYDNQELKIRELTLLNDDHDPGTAGDPETYIRTKLQDGDNNWDYENTSRGDLKDVNDLDVLYDETRHFLPVQIYPHSGANCSGGDYYANVRVKEWDPATPDDKVAQWRGLDMRTGSVYLADSSLPEDDPRRCNHSSGYSECDAKVRVGSFVQ